MKLEFVNHASVILDHGGVRLLCDPWLHGTSFNDGWALLAETTFKPDQFEGITHIWYSHEHPDHFSPRCLGEVPEPVRAGITVLFHETRDRKLVRYCESLGFRTQELRRGERTRLGPDFHLTCSQWDHTDDSWCLVEAGGRKALNLNDCMVNDPADVARMKEAVGEIDLLLTQFSIAGWDGNVEEHDRRHAGGRTMLARTVMQCRELAPRWFVPFASFVWFCHEENHYMNSGMVRVDEVVQAVERETAVAPVVLYPGDAWTVGHAHRNVEALESYRADYRDVPRRERKRAHPVELAELSRLAERFVGLVNGAAGPLRLRLRMARNLARHERRVRPGPVGLVRSLFALATLRRRPARVWLHDLGCAVRFDLEHGLAADPRPRERCDVELASDSLAYAFRFLWGGAALQINGRFHELRPHGRQLLFDALWTADGMNRDEGAEARPL